MSWPSLAGLTEMEIISVCMSLYDECAMTERLCISGASYEGSEMTEEDDILDWYELKDEEKASANLRKVFVMSSRCEDFFMRSEAAIGSEL